MGYRRSRISHNMWSSSVISVAYISFFVKNVISFFFWARNFLVKCLRKQFTDRQFYDIIKSRITLHFAVLRRISMKRPLFVFAGQSNMMGAPVFPAKEQIYYTFQALTTCRHFSKKPYVGENIFPHHLLSGLPHRNGKAAPDSRQKTSCGP